VSRKHCVLPFARNDCRLSIWIYFQRWTYPDI